MSNGKRTLMMSRGSRALHPNAVLTAEKNRASRIKSLQDRQKRGLCSRKELRELERYGLPYPQVNGGN